MPENTRIEGQASRPARPTIAPMPGTGTIVGAPGGRPAPVLPSDPTFWRRLLAPLLVVPAAFLLGIVVVGVLTPTPMGQRGVQTIAQVVVSAAILILAVVVWQSLPAHERRAAVALKHSWGGAIGLGVVVAAGILLFSVSLVAVAWRVDP